MIALKSNVSWLKLDAIKQAEKVYHLTAAEEHRLCFSLTDITSAGGKGEEYFLPGAHSDVGGGYREFGEEIEDFELLNQDKFSWFGLNPSKSAGNLKAFAKQIEKEGWYSSRLHENGEPQIEVKHQDKYVAGPMGMMGSFYEVDTAVKVYRSQVENTYRRIPLNLMVEETKKQGIEFEPEFAKHLKVPAELASVDSAIRQYIGRIGRNSCAQDWFGKSSADIGYAFNYEMLRNRYLHYSSRISLGHWPRFKNGKRFRQQYKG